MHVDGFRFDEGVGADPRRGRRAARRTRRCIWQIELSEALADTKIIAEAWDAAGAVPGRLVPRLPLGRVERPVPRRRAALRQGRAGLVGAVATRIAGSADLYQARGHLPDQQRQLRHLPRRVHARTTWSSYNEKHNEANGEGNRDGNDDNLSWNCGVEGPTDDPAVAGAARPADQELRRDPDAVAGRADVRRGRRGRPHPARQQQRLLPGQRDQLVRLERWSRATPDLLRFWKRLIALPPAPPGRCTAREFFTGAVNEPRACRTSPGTAPSWTRPAGTTRQRPRAGLHARRLRRRARHARDDEHVLGAARLRAARDCRPRAGTAPSTRRCRRPTTSPSPGPKRPLGDATMLSPGRSIVVLVSKSA